MKKYRILLLAALFAALLLVAGTAAAEDMTWAYLQQALSAGGAVSLTNDVTASASDGPLVVPEGVTVRLDLNGHAVSRGLSEAAEDGSVITVRGTLTLADSAGEGRITGGYATQGGGIYNAGSLTIEGGSIEHYSDFAQSIPSAFFFSDVEGCRVTRNGYGENDPESYEGRWETILTYLYADDSTKRVRTLDAKHAADGRGREQAERQFLRAQGKCLPGP